MALISLKTLAYDILKKLDDDLVRGLEIPELICPGCNKAILLQPLMPFTIITCGHVFHRLCIENMISPNMLSICPLPGCKTLILTEDVHAMEEHYTSQLSGTPDISNVFYIDDSPENARDIFSNDKGIQIKIEPGTSSSEGNAESLLPLATTHESALRSGQSPKKRANSSVHDNRSRKKAKKLVSNDNSPVLKRLIHELCTAVSSSEIQERDTLMEFASRNQNMSFLVLYYTISNHEQASENVRHKLLLSYYNFGEELEKRLVHYNYLEVHEAQKKVNDEVQEQLPQSISRVTLRKRTERARKMYGLFLRITDDKTQRMEYMQRIKTFTASSISKLSLDKIKYVASQVRIQTGFISDPHQFQSVPPI